MYDNIYEIRRYLFKRAKELGFSDMKSKIWVYYMLDTKRGQYFLKKIRSMYDSAIVLDLGCGYGSTTEAVSKEFDMVSMDIRYDRAYVTKMRSDSMCICADGVYTPFKNDSFDVIIASDILEHVSRVEQVKMCNEMYRIVRKGGSVVVKVPNRLQLFDNHNDFLIFVAMFPDKWRRRFLEKFGRSEYCDVRAYTLFGWMDLFRDAKFKVSSNLQNCLLLRQNFEFTMEKC